MTYDIRGTDLKTFRNALVGGRVRQGVDTFDSGTSTTVTLTAASKFTQHLTGALAMTVTLPVANGINAFETGVGTEFRIINNNSSNASVLLNGGTALGSIRAGETIKVVCLDASTAAGTWELIQLEKDDDSYAQFNITLNTDVSPTAGASWVLANGLYTALIPGTAHMRGDTPVVSVRDASGSQVVVDVELDVTNGNVNITVLENPNGREAFRVTIV